MEHRTLLPGERGLCNLDFVDLEQDYARLVEQVRLRRKDEVWHQRAIHHLLRVVTLGAQSSYLDSYVTTLWHTVYVTPDWETRALVDRYATLRHELVHVRQFERWGLFMGLAYLLLPLPFGLSWFRMRFERAAYEETIRVYFALGGRDAAEKLRAHVIRQFTSGAYGWMWPFPRAVARWYDRFVETLVVDSLP
jgi:hypothetical protein